MSNNNCVSYLEVLVARFDGNMKAALAKEERPDKRTREMWMECTKRRN